MSRDDDQPSDDALMAGVAEGRADAFASLFRRRQRDVYRFAMHMTGAPATAEDVTQDVFLAVMRDAGRYVPGRSSVTAWLWGIARNCARHRLAREHVENGALDDEGREAAIGPDQLTELARAERVALVRKAVLALPVRYREVVVLCDLQELPYADAAAAIGCAVGTVRSRLHRARGLLAGRLRELESIRASGPPHARAPAGRHAQPGRQLTPVEEPAPEGRRARRCLA